MNHDSGYHLLFSNPILVRELVQGFVSQPWVKEIDFDSIKRVNAKQHASTLERREGDIIYELHSFTGKPVYLYLFLEFQSTPDRWMALRLSVYVQLFWQQLIKGKQITANSKLPPVFPLVLYKGDQPWHCAHSVAQLIDLPLESSLWCYQPEMQYYIISEQQCAQSIVSKEQNIKSIEQGNGAGNLAVKEVVSSPLVSLLFRLESCKTVQQLCQLIETLAELMTLPEYQGVKRDVAAWLSQVRLPGFESDLNDQARAQFNAEKNNLNLNQFSEVKNMLADRIKQWEEELIEQGIQEGSYAARHAMQGTLIQMLNQKFEALPAATIKIIESYGIERLEVCLSRILKASSVTEVLE